MMTNEGSSWSQPKGGFEFRKWSSLVLCLICYVLVNFHTYTPSVLADDLAEGYNVSLTSVGLFSSMFFWSYGVTQPFVGVLVDFADSGIIIGIAGIITSIGTIICGSVSNFTIATIGRFILGIGCSCNFVAINKFISSWFNEDQFTLVISLTLCVGGVGGVLSQKPLIALKNAIRWRACFYIAAGVGGVASILILIFVRGSPITLGYPLVPGTTPPMKASSYKQVFVNMILNFGVIFKIYAFWLHSVAVFFSTSVYQNFSGLWAVSYLENVYNMTNSQASSYTTVLLVVNCVGSPILSIVVKLTKMFKWLHVICLASALVVCLIFVIFTSSLPKWTFYILFFLLGLCTTSTQAFTFTMYKMMVDGSMSGLIAGLGNCLIFIGSAIEQNLSSALMSIYGDSTDHAVEAYRNVVWIFNAVSVGIALMGSIFVPDIWTAKKEEYNLETIEGQVGHTSLDGEVRPEQPRVEEQVEQENAALEEIREEYFERGETPAEF